MWNSVVTNAGIALLARWAQGGTLAITGAKAGTGTVPTAQLMAATNVSGIAYTLSIVRYKKTEDGVEYLVQFEAAASAYVAKQIGIFASLDGGTSTLIAIYQTDSSGIEVPAYTEMPDYAIQFAASVQMANTGSLTVTIDPTAYVTMETLEDAIDDALEDVLTQSDIANNLTTTAEGKVLDARQGKALSDAVVLKVAKSDIDDTAGTGDTGKLWSADKLAGAFAGKKNTQTAVADPTASGTSLEFIATLSQDANGVITPTKKTVQDGTTSQKGIVQLEDSHTSTSTTKAATPKAVKDAYDLASTANTAAGNAATAAAGKANPSVSLSLTAAAANWSSADPSTQTISATGVTASNNIMVGAGTLTAQQQEAMVAAQIMCTAQGNGTITLTAFGEVPSIDLPIVVFILG